MTELDTGMMGETSQPADGGRRNAGSRMEPTGYAGGTRVAGRARQIAVGSVFAVVLLAPWFFAAWEMWWFWPFATLIFLAAGCTALAQLAGGGGPTDDRLPPYGWAYLAFLAYATVRAWLSPVFMDAERSVLLFVTPALIWVCIRYSFTERSRRRLQWAILVDLVLLASYALINHAITASRLVLWVPGFPQYFSEPRLTGTYFCPDHFAGLMELLLCFGLALVVSRERRRGWTVLGLVVLGVALMCVVLSRSRGGGLTCLITLFACLAFGLYQRRAVKRWSQRMIAASLVVLVVTVFINSAHPYALRFRSYFADADGRLRLSGAMWDRVRADSRPRMYASAWRAWSERPVFGIGAGMHQNVWPHFSASTDGNRELGIWPSLPYYTHHSYEVHNDWLQLLEEYGATGFLLFLVAAVLLMRSQWRGVLAEARRRPGTHCRHFEQLTGLLALVTMAFHSFGDFNLQMPATVWILAAIVVVSLAPGEPRHAGGGDVCVPVRHD